MIEFDHIAISGETLDEASDCVEAALGVSLQEGGAHDVFFTHNMLLGLEDGLYLEAIAINPAAPKPDRARWFDLDRFKGPARLTNWICRTDDIARSLDGLPNGMGEVVDLQRGDLRWQMAVPESGILPFDNCAPAIIEWKTAQHPARRLAPSGVWLRRLTICHPEAGALNQVLSQALDDDRIAFEKGDPALHAEFDTPSGIRSLGQ